MIILHMILIFRYAQCYCHLEFGRYFRSFIILFFIYFGEGVIYKATTSNVIVIRKGGQLPPSVFSHINVLSYMRTLQTLPAHVVVKGIYTELFRLHSCGLHTWVTKVLDLSKRYGISFNEINSRNFKLECKPVGRWHRESTPKLKILFAL